MTLILEHTGNDKYTELEIENVRQFTITQTCDKGVDVHYFVEENVYEHTFSYRLDECEHLRIKGL